MTQGTDAVIAHHPTVEGGPRIYGWECPCGKKSSGHWPTPIEAAYAALVHVRNPNGPS